MKAKTKAKLPAARVAKPIILRFSEDDKQSRHACSAVIPCRTRSEARAWVKLAKMTPEDRLNAVSVNVLLYCGPKNGSAAYIAKAAELAARAILKSLHLL